MKNYNVPGLGLPQESFYAMEAYTKEDLDPAILDGLVDPLVEPMRYHMDLLGVDNSLRRYATNPLMSVEGVKRSLSDFRSYGHPKTEEIILAIARRIRERLVEGGWDPAVYRFDDLIEKVGISLTQN